MLILKPNGNSTTKICFIRQHKAVCPLLETVGFTDKQTKIYCDKKTLGGQYKVYKESI